MRNMALVLMTMMAAGCDAIGGGGPLEGVWMFEAPNPEANCSSTLSTNLRGASIGGQNPSDWTEIQENDQSLDIFFARITHGRADDAVMIVADQVIPGTKVDKDTWEFTYVATLNSEDGRQHVSGYRYLETTDTEVNTVYTIRRESNRWLSGEANFDSVFTQRWAETDQWNPNTTGIFYGDLPAFNVGAAENIADSNDCLDQECFIAQETRCENSVGIVGTWTGFDGDGQFELEDNFTSAL